MKSALAMLLAAAMWTGASVIVYQGSGSKAAENAAWMLVIGAVVGLVLAIGFDDG